MAIPLLEYSRASQNQRVEGYVVPGDEEPRYYSTDNILSGTEMDSLIDAAYRQMFFYAFRWDREVALESQLRTGQITVRDFIRGLMLSKTFRDSFYDKNSNYRFVEQCIQRVLGRDPYSEQEKIAWSIVVATKGIQGFADALLNSEEYIKSFGYNIVPYQRRRVLPGRAEGERPFNIKSPRYDSYFRAKLGFPQSIWQTQVRRFRPQEKQVRQGDPSQFLKMAQSIKPRSNSPQKLSALNIDYERAVPYRKLS
ncbi:MAG: phycobilisome rod-core linker polypeptide CpcG [Leptolyngbyaceae cyanobacterium SM1_1_3]|nr:phycobilisome rod-core linker polypeptide CpcG [Leptolyngbyaceae cyanobacterium SM1_1_3]NJO11664.1 phycobilisome rod-core linker polypeptide CpcG [Leptolyngbyaceae cyanobacterium SL_1_1]